jgi:PAS domain S-box-containing protein
MTEESPAQPGTLNSEVATLILEHARDYAIMVLNRDGAILSWSAGAEHITGIPASSAVGVNFRELFTESDLAAGEDRKELDRAWRDGRAEDSRWHVRRNGERFWANGVTMALRTEVEPRLIKVIRDETRNRLAEEQRVLLLNELNHRINNTLVTVQSLMEQTLRAAKVESSVRDDLAARLQALSRAHRALMEQNWAGADLSDLVARALEPFRSTGADRFEIAGPPIRLSSQQSVSFSLVLHELATNAVKHGALSRPSGRVSVTWNHSLDEAGNRRMTFLWAEAGGPAVEPPIRRGFGTRLLASSFAAAYGGEFRADYLPEGLRCTILLKLSGDDETPMDLAAAQRT